MTDLGAWRPLTPDEVVEVFADLDRPWWIAGGWAIDLHLGRQTREHEDVDVLVLRNDQLALQRVLAGWDLHAADPPGTLCPWRDGEVLPPAAHDIWCRRTPEDPWCLQLMIDDTVDDTWVYRRHARVRRRLVELDGPASDSRRRTLAPEVQLLQKSKGLRPKDEADLRSALPSLDAARVDWLRAQLATTSPGHPWLDLL